MYFRWRIECFMPNQLCEIERRIWIALFPQEYMLVIYGSHWKISILERSDAIFCPVHGTCFVDALHKACKTFHAPQKTGPPYRDSPLIFRNDYRYLRCRRQSVFCRAPSFVDADLYFKLTKILYFSYQNSMFMRIKKSPCFFNRVQIFRWWDFFTVKKKYQTSYSSQICFNWLASPSRSMIEETCTIVRLITSSDVRTQSVSSVPVSQLKRTNRSLINNAKVNAIL